MAQGFRLSHNIKCANNLPQIIYKLSPCGSIEKWIWEMDGN